LRETKVCRSPLHSLPSVSPLPRLQLRATRGAAAAPASRRPLPAAAPGYDLWDDACAAAQPARSAAEAAAKRPRPPKRVAPGAALEVCPPGASYHPPLGAHQELIGAAVAQEHMRLLQAEMKPVRPPALGRAVAEQMASEMLFFQPELPEPPAEEGEEPDAPPRKARRLTQSERNRQSRAKAASASQQAAQLAKRQRKDLSELHRIQAELDAAADARAERAARLAAVRAERAATLPARLGKHRFAAPPVCVPLTHELHGSLRRVVPVPTLLRDRFSALQRSEKIEPRPKPAKYKRSKSYIVYEPGARGAKELEMHAQATEERRSAREAREAAAVGGGA
jgi:nucleolar protein 53